MDEIRPDQKAWCDEFFKDPVKELKSVLKYVYENCYLCNLRKSWAKIYKNPYNRCDCCKKIEEKLYGST